VSESYIAEDPIAGVNENMAQNLDWQPLRLVSQIPDVQLPIKYFTDNQDIQFDVDENWNHSRLCYEASRYGDVASLRALIKQGQPDLNYQISTNDSLPLYELGNTPLIIATERGHADVLKELIKGGVDVNFIGRYECGREYFEKTALIETISSFSMGKYQIIRILVEAGADPLQLVKFQDVDSSAKSAIQILLERSMDNQNGVYRVVEIFVTNGLDLNQSLITGYSILGTSMWRAKESSSSWQIAHLLQTNGAKLNEVDLQRSSLFLKNLTLFMEKLYVLSHTMLPAVLPAHHHHHHHLHAMTNNTNVCNEILMGILRDGVYLGSVACDVTGKGLFEYCISCGLILPAKMLWAAGCHIGLAYQWTDRSNFFKLYNGVCKLKEQEKSDIHTFLKNIVQQPRTLLDCARITVRTILRPGNLTEKVKKLEIPDCLKDHLVLSEIRPLIDHVTIGFIVKNFNSWN